MNQTHSQRKSTDDDQLQVEDGELVMWFIIVTIL